MYIILILHALAILSGIIAVVCGMIPSQSRIPIFICFSLVSGIFELTILFLKSKPDYQSNQKISEIYDIVKKYPLLSGSLIDDPNYTIAISKEKYDYFLGLVNKFDAVKNNFSIDDESELNKANVYFYIGNLKVRLNDYKGAIAEYSNAIKMNPNNADYFNNLGVAQFNNGKDNEAELNYRNAIKLAPQNPVYLKNYARSLIRRSKFAEAQKYVNTAYELNPNDIHSINMIGVLYAENNKYEKAKEWFTKALKLAPNDPSTYFNFGKLNKLKNDLVQAEEWFKKTIEKDANHYLAYNGLATLYKEIGKVAEALEHFKRGSEISYRSNSDILYNYGNFLKDQGRPLEAIAKYKQATEVNPRDSDAFNNWGTTLNSLGKPDEAIDKYTKTLQIDSGNTKVYYNWGNALHNLNQKEEAADKYKMFLSLSNGEYPHEEKRAKKYLDQLTSP